MTNKAPKLRKRHVDLLLMLIIRGNEDRHPMRRSNEDRLEIAKEALLGEKRPAGRTEIYDEIALFKILAEVQKRKIDAMRRRLSKINPQYRTAEWQAEIAREPLSLRAAARKFQHLAGSGASNESTERRLLNKASALLKDLQSDQRLEYSEMAELESLFDPESYHTQCLIQILDLLQDLGVQSETIWDESL